jgi:hypothetical protein
VRLQLLGKANLTNSINTLSNIATAGFGADLDPMADNFLFERNSNEGLMSSQASLENGALPLRHYAKNWMTSARVGIDLVKYFELFYGVLLYDNHSEDMVELDAVAGITFSLGPLKITMPLMSSNMISDMNNAGVDYAPHKYFLFTLDLRKLEPWGMIREGL